MKKCAVIILMFNDYESTISLIESMKDYKSLTNIIVVDNCSTNNSYEQVKPYENELIKVIKTDANEGIAKGNNFGAGYAMKLIPDLDYLLFSNPDVIVNEDSVISMIDFLSSNKEYGAVCPMELTKERTLAKDFAWHMPTYSQTVKSVMPIWVNINQKRQHPYLWFYDTDEAIKTEVFDADVIISCFIMTSVSAFEKVGGFLEKTFLYHEEDIYAFNLHKAGYKLAVLPQKQIVHLGCTSMNKSVKNWESKSKIMLDSSVVYLEECLKVGKPLIALYKMVYYIGVFERKCFRLLKSFRRGEQ